MKKEKNILITGAGGYLGRKVVEALVKDRRDITKIIATDLHVQDESKHFSEVDYIELDVRSPETMEIMKKYQVNVCIHLAAIVTPSKSMTREEQHTVDVFGTRNVLESCHGAGVKQIIISSSGAAYGYHADHPDWIPEDAPLRGNREFAYSDHKRQVEELLTEWRQKHPELKQLIFRPTAILGATTANQITALFHRPMVPGLMGIETPFTFIWDQDVADCIVKGVHEKVSGVYNLTGDGKVSMREIAKMVDSHYLPLPVWLVTAGLWLLDKIGMTQYGPEQVMFLRYRPCLSNCKLKKEFGYTPRKTSLEVIQYYLEHQKP